MSDGIPVGIDLGTTNSVIAAPFGSSPEVIENTSGGRKTPSVVAFKDGDVLVGTEAINQSAQNPEGTVHSIKSSMGDREYAFHAPDGDDYSPAEVSALILRKLKRDAEESLGRAVTNAVITVPAHFSNRQREATKRAGRIAGLEVDRIINEPTAACLAYGLERTERATVLVYDLGGGTFDVSLVSISDGVIEVIATDGDTQLGGDDWDAQIVDLLVDHVERETGATPEDDPQAMDRLWAAAKQAKHDLSSRETATVSLPFLFEAPGGTYTLETTIDRETFQRETAFLTDATIDRCYELFDRVDHGIGDVDEVLLVGGSTRNPDVAAAIESEFGIVPSKRIDADLTVALGAAAQAGIMNRSALPSGHDGELVLADDGEGIDDVVLLDVCPQTVGVKIRMDGRDNQLSRLIPKNTSVPERVTNEYVTVHDNQEVVDIEVYQGENQIATENELLDSFTLRGIPPAPAGEQTIEVEFELDEDGILDVSARNPDSGVTEGVTIDSEFGVSPREIDAMRSQLPRPK
ncbi:Hsp70 family protein [Halorubrum sp. JWXQ-INN 858]|uniref:Hsp70 family protein n=1 Tax=Halorubrum sp. JWXQ-INN 858 TaxID=2690782 RepID=UPI00135A7F80|nr:Hsp70 family protein [Halorubrum sp. JWXQ-INN 858]MWV63886.1 Hsp70 family protein [Halorubrum sp. JWXQ-INN 858]